MTIDSYLNKPFRIHGRKFYLSKVEDHISGANGYIICDEHDFHRANVEQITETGIGWLSYFLGVQVRGTLTYSDMEKNLIIN